MAVHSCANGKTNAAALKQHKEKAQLTRVVWSSPATCSLPWYMNQTVPFCCTTITAMFTVLWFYWLITSEVSCAGGSLMTKMSCSSTVKPNRGTKSVSGIAFLSLITGAFMSQQVGILSSALICLYWFKVPSGIQAHFNSFCLLKHTLSPCWMNKRLLNQSNSTCSLLSQMSHFLFFLLCHQFSFSSSPQRSKLFLPFPTSLPVIFSLFLLN